MSMHAMNFDLYGLAAPKTREGLLALANEMCAELDRVNSHFDSIFEDAECLTD